MDVKQIMVNSKINNFINSKRIYKKYKIMYHITSSENAKKILQNGFDISKSRTFAFGKGINLTSNINYLKNYYNEKNNTIILCIVKYNKLKQNFSDVKNKEYLVKYGYTKPKYMSVPKGFDGFYADNSNIYVLKSKKLVHPLCIIN
jgi:hypothetical protein